MMRMQRKHAQLLIVDLQEKLIPALHRAAAVIEACCRLVQIANRLGVPVTVSEHYAKGLGATVEPLRRALAPEAETFGKMHFSCMSDKALHRRFDTLRDDGRGQIVIAGIEAHVCVGQTALDLLADGYEVFVAADAVTARDPSSRDLAFARIRQNGGSIVDSEMVMFEWLEKAGTPEFKDLIKLLQPAPSRGPGFPLKEA